MSGSSRLLHAGFHPIAEMILPMALGFSVSPPWFPMSHLSSSSSRTLPLVVNGCGSSECHILTHSIQNKWHSTNSRPKRWERSSFPEASVASSLSLILIGLCTHLWANPCVQRDWIASWFKPITTQFWNYSWTETLRLSKKKGKQELMLGRQQTDVYYNSKPGSLKLPKTKKARGGQKMHMKKVNTSYWLSPVLQLIKTDTFFYISPSTLYFKSTWMLWVV